MITAQDFASVTQYCFSRSQDLSSSSQPCSTPSSQVASASLNSFPQPYPGFQDVTGCSAHQEQ